MNSLHLAAPPSSLSHQRDQSQRDQSQRDQSQRDQSSLGWLLIITLCCLCALSCRRDRAEQREDVLVVSVEQHSSWIRNFNPFSPNARRFTRAGVYEPLMIHNSVTGELTPWLATAYEWNQDYTELSFTIRRGVKFSDGTPLTPRDVVFSFMYLQRYPALDISGLWSIISSVEESANHQVTVILNEPFQPKLHDIAQHIIVPSAIWSKITDPVAFTNPHPVGSGPFTEVNVFRSQVFELSRNPHYWRKGRPAIRSLRFPAFPSNDQANLALVTGEIDWAGNFVPAIDRTFIAPDPNQRHYWFPLVGSMVNLISNTQTPPFDQLKVRRALSEAIDRERVVEIAMYSYTRPADSTGLSDGFQKYHDESISHDYQWADYNPTHAIKLLRDAGLRRDHRGWYLPESQDPISLTIDVVSGWSDWVRAAQVISHQLREIGIDARVRTSEFSSWFDRLRSGRFELAIAWADDRGSPYEYYRWLMGSETVKPVGESAAGNFHRFGDRAADLLLAQLKRGTSKAQEQALVNLLQRRYAQLTPVIPLFPNPQWGAANRQRITGFPSQADPYAPLSPNREPECLLVFDRLKPRASLAHGGER